MTTREDLLKYVERGDHKHEDIRYTQPIFEIIMFEYAEEGVRSDGTPNGWPDTGAEDHPGFYYDLDDAIEALHTNCCDLREYVYDVAMIVCRFPGLYDCAGQDARMYFTWNDEKQGYFEAEEPECFAHIAY